MGSGRNDDRRASGRGGGRRAVQGVDEVDLAKPPDQPEHQRDGRAEAGDASGERGGPEEHGAALRSAAGERQRGVDQRRDDAQPVRLRGGDGRRHGRCLADRRPRRPPLQGQAEVCRRTRLGGDLGRHRRPRDVIGTRYVRSDRIHPYISSTVVGWLERDRRTKIIVLLEGDGDTPFARTSRVDRPVPATAGRRRPPARAARTVTRTGGRRIRRSRVRNDQDARGTLPAPLPSSRSELPRRRREGKGGGAPFTTGSGQASDRRDGLGIVLRVTDPIGNLLLDGSAVRTRFHDRPTGGHDADRLVAIRGIRGRSDQGKFPIYFINVFRV